MVLGLVGFDRFLAGSIDQAVTQQGHFCMVFHECAQLESMIRDSVELPCFDALIYEGTQNARVVRFALGKITPLRGELFKELSVVALESDFDFWEPIRDEVDHWLQGLQDWRCELVYLFPTDEGGRA
ncbi:MAG: hypothetical protein WCK51_12010 [Armatimonadota bacterium]